MSSRSDGRRFDELRPVVMMPDFIAHPEGSVLIECGATRVVCCASLEERVPPFRRGTGSGWITSEYGMLPRSTSSRMIREATRGRPSGRTQEIQRIIGRALRSVVNLDCLGERTIWLDCDVLQADGGTRTASVTGAFVALGLAVEKLRSQGILEESPLLDFVGAVSVGIVGGEVCLDLDYQEDSSAEVDMNVVMTGSGSFVEIQGTAEARPFDRNQLGRMLDVSATGIRRLIEIQRETFIAKLGHSEVIQGGQRCEAPAGNQESG